MPSVGFSSVKRVPRKCLVAEPNPRSLSMSPFAPDFPDLEFETFQIVHVPFLTGWTVGGRAGIPAILILVGFPGRMGFPLIFFKCACVVGNELMRLMPGIAFLPASHSPSLSASHWDEGVSGETAPVEEPRTPLELIDAAYKSLRQATAEDLLSMLKVCSPVVLRVGGCSAAHGNGLRRGSGSRNGHGQVRRRRHRWGDQAGQVGAERGLYPGEAVGRSGGSIQ